MYFPRASALLFIQLIVLTFLVSSGVWQNDAEMSLLLREATYYTIWGTVLCVVGSALEHLGLLKALKGIFSTTSSMITGLLATVITLAFLFALVSMLMPFVVGSLVILGLFVVVLGLIGMFGDGL